MDARIACRLCRGRPRRELTQSISITRVTLGYLGGGWVGGADTIITLKKYVSHRNLLEEGKKKTLVDAEKQRGGGSLSDCFLYLFSLHFPEEEPI